MNQNKGFPPLSYLSKVFAIDRKQIANVVTLRVEPTNSMD